MVELKLRYPIVLVRLWHRQPADNAAMLVAIAAVAVTERLADGIVAVDVSEHIAHGRPVEF